MKVIDLSHPISPGMPVYPSTEPPTFVVSCTVERDGFFERKISLYSHTGTHIDAPSHMISGARAIDEFPACHFIGKAYLLDASSVKGPEIDVSILKFHEPWIKRNEFLLFHTGWDRLWGDEGYFEGYPVLSEYAADWLGNFDLKGVGTDTISLDSPDSRDFPVHKSLLRHGVILIENLAKLKSLPRAEFLFACLPLNLKDGDGSPVRAIAVIE